MSMSTGGKIALGCGIAALLGMIAIVVTVGLGAFWLKGKAEEMTGGLEGFSRKAEQMQEWERKANANAFRAPADGVIAEDRFLKFLDVRKEVYGVYAQHEAEFERFAARTKDEKDLSVSETLEGAGRLAGLVADVRLAQMKGLAVVGMNEEEYRYIQMAVYQSAWASEVEKETGQMPADTVRQQMETLPDHAREAMEHMKESGGPEANAVTPEEMAEAMDQVTRTMGSAATAVDVPRANVELFRKHEAAIRKYAMHGLAMVGL